MFDILYHPYADQSGDDDGDGHVTKSGGRMSRGRCFYPFIGDVMVTSRSGVGIHKYV